MQFDSLHALLDMQGHGVYVWSAMAISIFVCVGLILHPLLKRKRLMKALQQRALFEE